MPAIAEGGFQMKRSGIWDNINSLKYKVLKLGTTMQREIHAFSPI